LLNILLIVISYFGFPVKGSYPHDMRDIILGRRDLAGSKERKKN